MKNLQTFEEFLNESQINEAKLHGNEWKLWVDIEDMIDELKNKYSGKVAKGKIKEFILDYASDLNEAKLHGNEWKLWVDIEDMINQLKNKYAGKVAKGKIKEFILDYSSDLNEGLTEKITYPDGDKSTGDPILDKLAKLLNSGSAKIEVTAKQVRAVNLALGFSPASTFTISAREEYFFMNTNKGYFRVDIKDIKKAEDLYDELESIVQAGKTKRPSSRETNMFGK